MNIQTLTHTWPEFAKQILAFVDELGLSDLNLHADHCALRVNNLQTAIKLVEDFSKEGDIVSNNMINGRPILIIKLHKPLSLGNQHMSFVELPYPSEKVYPQEGWEHIELVLPCDAKTCDELAATLIAKVPSIEQIIDGNTQIKVKQSSPKGEHERLANPTIAFKQGNLCVKVHPHPIEKIIESERTQ